MSVMICHYLNNINLCVYLVLVILGLSHESMLFPPLSVVHHLPSPIILNALICLWMHIRLIFRALKQKIRGEEEEEGVNGDKFDHCNHPSHFVRYLKKLNTTTSPELEFQSILCPRLFFSDVLHISQYIETSDGFEGLSFKHKILHCFWLLNTQYSSEILMQNGTLKSVMFLQSSQFEGQAAKRKTQHRKDLAKLTLDFYKNHPKEFIGCLNVQMCLYGMYSVSYNLQCYHAKRMLRWANLFHVTAA